MDKNELENLILVCKLSYNEIGRRYNITGNAIKKTAKRMGINVPVRRVINKCENFSHKGNTNNLVNIINDNEFINMINNSKGWQEIGEKLGYKSIISSNVKEAIYNRCAKLGIEPIINKSNNLLLATKGDIFKDRKNWQSARSAIRKMAYKIYYENNPNPKCAVCGYNNHIEVAHIKAVSKFDNDTLITEINSISNLIGLCPNHHWEYDNGVLNV